ncbi:integrator complex subunit 15 [Tribolium castaneum]|uniref:integrator complex subunit 15 n=1 Tax=Tribolium castaneum TaxID=7070 RepID=UPI00046C138D
MTSEVNLKQTLRKLEFPLCAKEALNKIGELICGRITSIKNMDLALNLMSEFIFYEVDRRGNKRTSPLSALMELHLLEILFEHFNSLSNEAARNTVFLSLFSGTTAMQRAGILSKLVSLAIGIPSPAILTSASTWMQQLGCTSVNSCKLAEAIVYDYFHLVPSASERMKTLPDVAPQFTANFLTAVAENYYNSKNKDQTYPSEGLLQTITFWISQNACLCIAAQQKQAALPPGAIAMEATTAIAGLIRWCTLAPLCDQDSDLYCHLHLALLNSILEIPQTQPPKAISAQHLTVALRHILLSSNKGGKQPNLQIALDRFAQAVQVALATKCVYGKIDDLMSQLQQLPFNKLLSIIINTHKESK